MVSETSSVANSKKSGKAQKAKVPNDEAPKDVLPPSASSTNNKTPKKHPGVPKRADTVKASVQSGTQSSRALAQMSLLRLEEKQKLEEQKLENQRREIQKERERLRKERELEEQENAITRKQLQILEQYLEEKHDLEEQLVEGEAFSQSTSRSGKSMTRKWLEDQQTRSETVQKNVAERRKISYASENSTEESANKEEGNMQAPVVKNSKGTPETQANQVRNDSRRRTPRYECANRDNEQEESIAQPSVNQLAARQLWPKNLPIFSGDPEEWPIFYSSYLDSNAACGYSSVENFIRLRYCLKGPAREAVVTKLMFPHAVPSIIETLRRLYGRPELLVRNLLGKVRRLDAPKPERLDSLINFGMAIQQLCDHLEAANLRGHLTNPTLLEELVDKLPAAIKLEWVRHKRAFVEPSLKEFGEFMDRLVVDASEVTSIVPIKHNQKAQIHTYNENGNFPPVNPSRKPCPICSKLDQRVRNCEDFKQMSLDERWEAIECNRLCELCLSNHGNWACKSRYYCNVGNCRARHHPLLHRDVTTTAIQADCKAHRIAPSAVLFHVVAVTLFNGTRSVDTFAFLDEGSSHTLIDASITRSLGAVGVPEPMELTWTSNVTRKESTSERVDLMISAQGGQEQFKLLDERTVSALNLPKQNLRVDKISDQFEHLDNIPISSFRNAEPKLLIGLQNLELIAPIESRIGRPGEPIAVRSALGWAIYGPCRKAPSLRPFVGLHQSDQELNEIVRQQFVLEDTGICPTVPLESAEDARARELLESTTFRENGRFVTGLLWRSHDIRFPDSLPMATKRLKNLETKLARDPELRSNVHQQIHEYIKNNYAHNATQDELRMANSSSVWYLPLNVVTHPRKPEKKRLIWDAAAKVNGVSLNSQLLKGPDLLVLLPGVICKFRERRIAFGGDIEKMFHQIRIKPEDTHSQRFLFRFDENQFSHTLG